MKNILITGGAGFIGSHLVDSLPAEEWRITVVDDFNDFYDPAIKSENVRLQLENPNYNLFRIDIRDKPGLETVFENTRSEFFFIL